MAGAAEPEAARQLTLGYIFERGGKIMYVLAAMSVLAIILLLLTQVFGSSTKAWNSGTQRMDQNIGARAVMDLIARDLSGAVSMQPSSGGASPSVRSPPT